MLSVVLDSSVLVSRFLTESGTTARLLMLVLGQYKGIRIVTPRRFLDLIQGAEPGSPLNNVRGNDSQV
jgi:hypothetical protein